MYVWIKTVQRIVFQQSLPVFHKDKVDNCPSKEKDAPVYVDCSTEFTTRGKAGQSRHGAPVGLNGIGMG